MDSLNYQLEIPNFYYPKDNKLRRKENNPFVQKDPELNPSGCDNENVSVIKDPVFVRNNRIIQDPPLSVEDKLNPRNNSIVLQAECGRI